MFLRNTGLDPIANTGDKGGIIDLKGNHYIGASDGIALRVKNTAKNTIKTKLYFEVKSGIDGTQSGYSLTGGTIYFYGLDGKVSEYNATSTDRTMVIPSFFDGVIYMPYSSFVPYKYQGTTNWGNATIANKLVKGSTGLTAYPEGRMASLSFYIQKDNAHTTANINPFILNEIYGVSENESSFTVIKHEGAFKASTANGKDNMNVYAYPLAKQTYEFYINGIKTLESDMAKYDLVNNDIKLSYGEKLSFNVEALNNATIQSVTIDDNPISDYSFINYNEEEATHIVNVTTSSETLYEITASYDESQVDISFDDKAYTGPLNIKENSKVVVKVNAKNNYKIANVLVNGEIITLDEDNSFEIDATSNTNIEVISCLDYLEFTDFNLINSKLDNTAFVMDPTLTSGANNAGGNILSLKNIELANTTSIALRIKNLEDYDYIINTLYIQCTDNYSYSLYDSTIRFISLDGSETTTSMSSRQVKVPASFDGYMVIDYNQLVEIRTGGNYFWTKRASDHLTANNYPTKKLNFVSFYFPVNNDMAKINELVVGSDVYTISSDNIKQYVNSLSTNKNTLVDSIIVKNYPANTINVKCNNENVTLNKNTFNYADTITVTPKNGYTITSAKINDDSFITNEDGSFSLRVNKDYGENVVIDVITSQKIYYTIEANYDSTATLLTINGTDYDALNKYEENNEVTIEAVSYENYAIDSVKVNGEIITLVDNKYTLKITTNTTIEIISYLKYDEYSLFAEINSEINEKSMVFDPTITSGATNIGGHVYLTHPVELANTTSLALRIKNLENYDYIINTLYIQATDNYSYSTYNSIVRFITLDGNETTTSMSARQVKIPASFDGYMVIDYNQLVEIRTGGSYFWNKNASDHLTVDKYPTKKLTHISIYFPVNKSNENINEIVLGSDVYTLTNNTIKGYDELSLNKTTMPVSINFKYFPVFNKTITCNNENVTLNTKTISYADTITITPNNGYTITSAKINDDSFIANEDGSFSLRINKDYGENVVIDVITSQKIYYTIEANYDSTVVLLTIDGADYDSLNKYEENNKVTIEVVSYENYVIDSVKINGEIVTLVDNKYTLKITANTIIEISSHLYYDEYESFNEVNSNLNTEAIIMDPTLTSGANNTGGNIYLTKQIELANTTSVALRIKNLESYDYILDALYIQLTDNYSYSTYNSIVRFIALDGSETATSMTARQVKIPANFDGYMVIDYNQLVEIRAGSGYFWDKKSDDDKLTLDKYPTKKLSYVSIFFPTNKNNEKINEIVLGNDVYTISNNKVKEYLSSLSINKNTLVDSIIVKNYITTITNVTCTNGNVTLNKNTFNYADTITITPKDGYTITSAKINDDSFIANEDGSFSLRINKDYGENVVLDVITSQKIYYTIDANYNSDEALLT